jgi:hypothetical protein
MIISNLLYSNEFENNCFSCHKSMQMYRFFQKYVQKYSSEKRVKEAIFEYMKDPKQENSIMPFGFIRRFGVKPKLYIEDETLKNIIDEYYKTFDFKKRIK